MDLIVEGRLEFFHVSEELSDLVRLGLAAVNLKIQRARCPGVLEDMMAALGPIPLVTNALAALHRSSNRLIANN
jgi:hypothetical protein